jgi:hypothetical protein
VAESRKTNCCFADLMWLSRDGQPQEEVVVNVVCEDGKTRQADVVEFGGKERGMYITVRVPKNE